MKTLPNGITIFNATPHVIRFWHEGWPEPVEVESDEIISARIVEYPGAPKSGIRQIDGIEFIEMIALGTDEGAAVINVAHKMGADLIVGSIIAAQAYPDFVVGMTPSPGYERVKPSEKRMNPDKFVIF